MANIECVIEEVPAARRTLSEHPFHAPELNGQINRATTSDVMVDASSWVDEQLRSTMDLNDTVMVDAPEVQIRAHPYSGIEPIWGLVHRFESMWQQLDGTPAFEQELDDGTMPLSEEVDEAEDVGKFGLEGEFIPEIPDCADFETGWADIITTIKTTKAERISRRSYTFHLGDDWGHPDTISEWLYPFSPARSVERPVLHAVDPRPVPDAATTPQPSNNQQDEEQEEHIDQQDAEQATWSTNLHLATQANDVVRVGPILERALTFGVQLDDYILQSALDLAARRGDVEVMSLLLQHGVRSPRALQLAASAKRVESVRVLLQHQGYQHGTLSHAVKASSGNERGEILELLLLHGADPDETSEDQPLGPPLLDAANSGNTEAFTRLLNAGASIGKLLSIAQTRQGITFDINKALHLVVDAGDTRFAAILVMNYGASVDETLVLAAKKCNLDAARRLLDMGAQPFQPNADGLTAYQAGEHTKLSGTTPSNVETATNVIALLLGERQVEAASNATFMKNGSVKLLNGIRFRFISQCKIVRSTTEQSPERLGAVADSISTLFQDHRRAWLEAMWAMKRLSTFRAPKTMKSAVAFLCLAKAITAFLQAREGDNYSELFLESIPQMLEIMESQDGYLDQHSVAYHEVMKLAWGYSPSDQLLAEYDTIMVRHMQNFVARLMLECDKILDLGESTTHHTPPNEADSAWPKEDASCTSSQQYGLARLDSHNSPQAESVTSISPSKHPPDRQQECQIVHPHNPQPPDQAPLQPASLPPLTPAPIPRPKSDFTHLGLMRSKIKETGDTNQLVVVNFVLGGLFALVFVFFHGMLIPDN